MYTFTTKYLVFFSLKQFFIKIINRTKVSLLVILCHISKGPKYQTCCSVGVLKNLTRLMMMILGYIIIIIIIFSIVLLFSLIVMLLYFSLITF